MKKLYRQPNGVFGGICLGIAKYFDIDDVIIRLIFIILFFTSFPIVILYIIMWVILPKQPDEFESNSNFYEKNKGG